MNPLWWLLVPAAYLIGSLSFAWVVGRLHGIDLRQHGSGNLGATNAGRVLGGRWFFIVFAADLLKGLAPVLATVHLVPAGDGARPWLDLAVAIAVLLGHSFTCFHGFKGGKAVATTLGVLFGLVWLTAALGFAVWTAAWLVGAFLVRLPRAEAVAPASMLAALATPGLHLALTAHPWSAAELPRTLLLFAAMTLILVRHRSNAAKLFAARRAAR
jgi:glycerol-3-phosphate acyltransferase PlsY